MLQILGDGQVFFRAELGISQLVIILQHTTQLGGLENGRSVIFFPSIGILPINDLMQVILITFATFGIKRWQQILIIGWFKLPVTVQFIDTFIAQFKNISIVLLQLFPVLPCHSDACDIRLLRLATNLTI